jgi:DNA-binding response OmpR family regulator
MKVLFMSGYTDGMAVAHGVAIGQVPFLQKPFTPSELHRRVRVALGDAALQGVSPPSPIRPAPGLS